MKILTKELKEKVAERIIERFMPADPGRLKSFTRRKDACVEDIFLDFKEWLFEPCTEHWLEEMPTFDCPDGMRQAPHRYLCPECMKEEK